MCLVVAVSVAEGVGEGFAAARHARADRADGASDDLGGVVVGEADDLGEHDRFPLRVGERGQHLGGLDDAEHVGRGQVACRVGGGVGAPAGALAEVFEADVAGDAEHPRLDRSAFPAAQMGDDAQEGLLGEIVRVADAREVDAEPPDVGLERAQELLQGVAVASLSGGGQPIEIEHAAEFGISAWNFPSAADHQWVMECGEAREILSARLDDAASRIEIRDSDAHLVTCGDCRQYWDDIAQITRRLRVRDAEPVPDVASVVLARAHPPLLGRGEWVRWGLGFVALCELILALPGLVAGEGASTVHDSRHIGSFGAAIAVGLLYVAWRPARAFGILPIVAALAATMATAAIVDIASGRTTSFAELHHLLELAGLWLVWALAGYPMPRRPGAWRVRRAGASAL